MMILNLSQASSYSCNSLEQFCEWADSSRFETARWQKPTPLAGDGRNPTTARSSGTSAKAPPEGGFARIASARFSRCQTAVFCSGLSV